MRYWFIFIVDVEDIEKHKPGLLRVSLPMLQSYLHCLLLVFIWVCWLPHEHTYCTIYAQNYSNSIENWFKQTYVPKLNNSILVLPRKGCMKVVESSDQLLVMLLTAALHTWIIIFSILRQLMSGLLTIRSQMVNQRMSSLSTVKLKIKNLLWTLSNRLESSGDV